MLNYSDVVVLSWITFLLYWLYNWKKVKPSKVKRSNFGIFKLTTVLVAMVFLIIINRSGLIDVCEKTFGNCFISFARIKDPTPFVGKVGAITGLFGLIIAILARYALSENWSPKVELKKEHKLVTSGVYAYVRHPIYFGMALMATGTVIVAQSKIVFFLFLIIILIFLNRIKREEDLMQKTFPKEYPIYKNRTKSLIPYIW